jgi:hypothetical protein
VREGRRNWVRPIGSLDAQPLLGRRGGRRSYRSGRPTAACSAFLNGKLKTVDASGDRCRPRCARGQFSRAPRGTEMASSCSTRGQGGALFRVSANGGEPAPVTTLAPQKTAHRHPFFLPDGRHFCSPFRRTRSAGSSTRKRRRNSSRRIRACVRPFDRLRAGRAGVLLFIRQSTLVAQRSTPRA